MSPRIAIARPPPNPFRSRGEGRWQAVGATPFSPPAESNLDAPRLLKLGYLIERLGERKSRQWPLTAAAAFAVGAGAPSP